MPSRDASRSYRERPTTARSSSAPSPVATAFSSCLPRWASTSTRQEQRKLFSTTHVRGRASCSRAGGTLHGMARTCTAWKIKLLVHVVGRLARLARVVDLDDQVEACRRVFASNTRWTVVRGSDLEEGESQGLPVWSRHVGDPILASNITRRVDFALFMVAALENDALVHEAPAIVGCKTPSAFAHAEAAST